MPRNFSIDLETFGTGPYSVITSVGVARFRPMTAEIVESREWHIDVNNSVANGLRMDPNTVIWWLQQSEAARHGITAPYNLESADRPVLVTLPQFFRELRAFMCPDGIQKTNVVWGNGPGFDCNKLNEAAECIGESTPWEFWNERCVRTVKDLAKIEKQDIQRTGTHHTAKADAEYQALIVSEAHRRLHLDGQPDDY